MREVCWVVRFMQCSDYDSYQGDLISEIRNLLKKNNAIILSHYYQDSEIQDLADFIGDSLELSRKAVTTDADTIVFCGVYFMAEVAKILNPKKKVLIPDMNAGCSLADSCNASDFKRFREKYHDHLSITYINCSAEVKALSDIICTSSNAEIIINQLPVNKKIIFAPDKFLGAYLEKKTGREMVLWPGTCIVHESFSERELIDLMTRNSDAHVIAHPECPENLLRHANFIGSTSKLLAYVKERNGHKFIVLTEEGIVHQMKKFSCNNSFYTLKGSKNSCEGCAKCPHMRLNTLEKIHQCLIDQKPEVYVPHDVSNMAKKSLNAMLMY